MTFLYQNITKYQPTQDEIVCLLWFNNKFVYYNIIILHGKQVCITVFDVKQIKTKAKKTYFKKQMLSTSD